VIIAQISDMHIRPEGTLAYRRVETGGFLSRCVERIRRMDPRPDVVLATGDLVEGGSPDEYRRLRALLAPLPMPVYLIPGNHDDRGALAQAFPDHAYLPRAGGFQHYAIDDFPLRLVGLDTLVPGKAGGELCQARLAWVAKTLDAGAGRPTAIFMHHPPFATGISHMDELGLAGADGLERILLEHPEVQAILCGHLHRPIHMRWGGTVASTAPSTAHQVALDLRPDAPLAFVMEPPGFQVHVWSERTGLVSHTSYTGDFAGPYPFREMAH
jgi:3',5'-cyclic AMP phosphodiesterase CpdA